MTGARLRAAKAASPAERGRGPRWRPLLAALTLCLTALAAAHARADTAGSAQYDVIVVGSEPEAIAAAVAAAETGAKTLLISADSRPGGLFVLGALNVLDLRTQPVNYQRGIFERWWRLVGRGTSFDVERAERAFRTLLREAGVEARLGVAVPEPVMEGQRVVGVRSGPHNYRAEQVVDGTADMEFAALAGAGYTIGFESLGYQARMVDTLVFRISGVDWAAIRRAARERGRAWAVVDDHVAWGHFGGYPAAYQPQEPGIRLRGLNLGLQEDGSVLVNALLIHGIDPFDPASRAEGRARAEREAVSIVDYLARGLPGFSEARYAGAAEELYIRESRHLEALCTLTADDVLDNRLGPLDVAVGGYPLDVQPLSEHDTGFVFGTPEIYGAPLCVAVPNDVYGLWIVGKSAGYDPIAASSARVVPFGMAVAEGVGVAAALAADAGLEPAEFAYDDRRLRELRGRLLDRGAYLPEPRDLAPVGPHTHPHYDAWRLMVSRGLALGGYENDPRLDTPVAAVSYVYLLANVSQRFFGEVAAARELVGRYEQHTGPLDRELALEITAEAARLLGRTDAAPAAAWHGLPAELTRGDTYSLAAALVRAAAGGH